MFLINGWNYEKYEKGGGFHSFDGEETGRGSFLSMTYIPYNTYAYRLQSIAF